MLIGHKTFYVKGGKFAYFKGDNCPLYKTNYLYQVFKQYNDWMKEVLNEETELMSYIIFYDDGSFTNGFLTPKMLDTLRIYTEDELIIKDIIE
jgi:hypothetical protein